ncbi:MAG: CerR family C-terminal domain-containing protein [Gammaproteobacteria bacterium]|jgi:AcrR family transcriptional regulator
MSKTQPARFEAPVGADPAPRADSSSRGEMTREALIRAAIDLFGHAGFNAVSTRAISEAAGVNQALIGYHFGGKPGLYLAALNHIADSVDSRIGPLVAGIEAELDADDGDAAAAGARAVALLHRFTDAFAAMLTGEESKAWARLILREQQDPSEGFEVLYATVMRRILGMTTRLVARARRLDAETDQCRLTALTIIGQVLVFRVGREAVLRHMGWTRLSGAELEAIRCELRHNVTAIVQAEQSQ